MEFVALFMLFYPFHRPWQFNRFEHWWGAKMGDLDSIQEEHLCLFQPPEEEDDRD